jgi:hypothetical protein
MTFAQSVSPLQMSFARPQLRVPPLDEDEDEDEEDEPAVIREPDE